MEFARSISGRAANYEWSGTTDDNGQAMVEIVSPRVSGNYQARAWQGSDQIGRWSSIPINGGFESVQSNDLLVTGTLTMMGVPKEVKVPVKILGRGNHPKTCLPIAGFDAKMKFKLSDLGVDVWTNAAGILGDTLNIRLKMVGVDKELQANL